MLITRQLGNKNTHKNISLLKLKWSTVPVKGLSKGDCAGLVVDLEQGQAVRTARGVQTERHLAVLVRVHSLQAQQLTVHLHTLRDVHRIHSLREHRPVFVYVNHTHIQL